MIIMRACFYFSYHSTLPIEGVSYKYLALIRMKEQKYLDALRFDHSKHGLLRCY